jgi:hypothetical protein
MRISKVLAVAAAGCALAGGAMLPAAAGASHSATKAKPAVASGHVFHTTLSTHAPRKGQVMTLTGTGAKKKTPYTCVLTVLKGSAYWVDTSSLKPAKSSKKGKVVCKETYEPYTAVSITGGTTSHKCPLSKKDKKAHYKCGFAVSTTDKTSNGIQYFSPKK